MRSSLGWWRIKIYETILKQSEAEKLTANVAQIGGATLLQTVAEKEFETQFSEVCTIAREALMVKSVHSSFLKKVLEDNGIEY